MNPIKKLALLLLLTALAGVCMTLEGQVTPPGKKLYTLYPPLNFAGTMTECNGYLYWQKPQMPNGTTPAGLLGYNLYRNGSMIQYISNPETLSYFDYMMDPLTFTYTITAYYDLASYGSPGQFGESPAAGPVILTYNCSFSLPLYEPWDQGNFQFQSWVFTPSQGNWVMNTLQGNPAPTASFNGTPALTNYKTTMKSLLLPGNAWVCANMFLEFDYKLTDVSAGGTEKLTAEYYVNNSTYQAVEMTNLGSTGWIHQKIDISQVCGKYFRIGFNASGSGSVNIGSWLVDNIQVYAVCKGPESLTYTRTGNVVSLSWQPPLCDSLQGVIGYNVYRTDQSGLLPFSKLNASPVVGNAFDDHIPGWITSGLFRYYVAALHLDPPSGTILCEAQGDTVLVDYAVGIKTEVNPGISMYPQPANDILTVKSTGQIESWELFNIVGEKILSINGEKRAGIKVPVSALPSGIYLARIKNTAGIYVQKISVMH